MRQLPLFFALALMAVSVNFSYAVPVTATHIQIEGKHIIVLGDMHLKPEATQKKGQVHPSAYVEETLRFLDTISKKGVESKVIVEHEAGQEFPTDPNHAVFLSELLRAFEDKDKLVDPKSIQAVAGDFRRTSETTLAITDLHNLIMSIERCKALLAGGNFPAAYNVYLQAKRSFHLLRGNSKGSEVIGTFPGDYLNGATKENELLNLRLSKASGFSAELVNRAFKAIQSGFENTKKIVGAWTPLYEASQVKFPAFIGAIIRDVFELFPVFNEESADAERSISVSNFPEKISEPILNLLGVYRDLDRMIADTGFIIQMLEANPTQKVIVLVAGEGHSLIVRSLFLGDLKDLTRVHRKLQAKFALKYDPTQFESEEQASQDSPEDQFLGVPEVRQFFSEAAQIILEGV